jgi:hypothetical protein
MKKVIRLTEGDLIHRGDIFIIKTIYEKDYKIK